MNPNDNWTTLCNDEVSREHVQPNKKMQTKAKNNIINIVDNNIFYWLQTNFSRDKKLQNIITRGNPHLRPKYPAWKQGAGEQKYICFYQVNCSSGK